MSGSRGKRDRGNRQKRKKRARRPTEEKRYRSHPLYGDVPLVQHKCTDARGRSCTCWTCDEDYRPRMPRGAVAGDVRKQAYCTMCHVPRYFYVDQAKTCVQCGRDFIFSGDEQKYWYETLKFHFNSVAIRCPPCRRRRRTEVALRQQIAAAKAGLRSTPREPGLLIDLATAIVAYRERTGDGNLNEAISACRKAHRLWPDADQCLFLEALCQMHAGRTGKAQALFREFVARAEYHARLAPMVRRAREYLHRYDG